MRDTTTEGLISITLSADLQRSVSAASPSIAAGITVGLIASVVQSLGITIQRKSHVLNQQRPESEQVVEHRAPGDGMQRLWQGRSHPGAEAGGEQDRGGIHSVPVAGFAQRCQSSRDQSS